MTSPTSRLKTHNTNLAQKIEVRALALDALRTQTGSDEVEGMIYLPYAGFGECAKLYPDDKIIGCDVDRDALAWWQANRPAAEILMDTAETFTGFGDHRFAIADLDAYGQSLFAIAHFFTHAHTAPALALIMTDSSLTNISRSKKPFNFDTMKFEQTASIQAKEQRARWFGTDVREWLARISGYTNVALVAEVKRDTIAYASYLLAHADIEWLPPVPVPPPPPDAAKTEPAFDFADNMTWE